MHLCFAVKEDDLGNVQSQTEMHKKNKTCPVFGHLL